MECAPPAAGFLYWVGASTIAYLALRASYSLFRAFQVWCVGNEALVGPRLGEWAVVTGGTDGIGKAYAEELAKRGMKIVLISRSQDKLNQVSNNITEDVVSLFFTSSSCCWASSAIMDPLPGAASCLLTVESGQCLAILLSSFTRKKLENHCECANRPEEREKGRHTPPFMSTTTEDARTTHIVE